MDARATHDVEESASQITIKVIPRVEFKKEHRKRRNNTKKCL